MQYKIPINGEWREFTTASIEALKEKGSPEAAELLMLRLREYEKNRLAYVLPHGVPWRAGPTTMAGGRIKLKASHYPREFKNDGVAFLNDRRNDYQMLVAPRKTGKTFLGATKICVESLDCDPEWEIFTKHRVIHKPFEGPSIAVIASFSQANLRDLWKVYQEVMPRRELGPYAADWGRYPGETAAKRYLSFGDGRPKGLVTAYSKTEFIFLCYTQQQHVWESFKAKYLHADEQIKLNLLRAWEDGSSTCGDYTPAIFTMSGFVLPERPDDTGAAGPLKPIWDGRTRGGKSVGRYNLDVPSTPDVILSKSKKAERYDRYVNPAIARSEKDERRGLAVYYPGWEPGSGLAFGPDVWDREIHVINPLWADDKTPRDPTKWRIIDYADTKITCCAWFAVGPNYAYLYRLLYEPELSVAEAARRIIEMSHNEQVLVGTDTDEDNRATYSVYQEKQTGEQFYTTILDSRAASWKRQGTTLIEVFQRHGIEDIVPASGERNEIQIPAFKDWLLIDRHKDHPWHKLKDGTPVKGCPRLFVFDGRCGDAIDELELMPVAENGTSVINQKFAHDFIDCAKYWASDDPCYMGDQYSGNEERERLAPAGAPYTGY